MSLLKLSLFIAGMSLLLIACIRKNEKPRLFSVAVITLKGDTVIESVAYCNNRILCLQANGKLLVIDTLFKKDEVITAQFAKFNIAFLHVLHDSVFVAANNQLFYIKNNFALQPASDIEFDNKYRLPYYSDSNYSVYACSAGEWGGKVYFRNKQNKKLFAYPVTCVQQVFKFGNEYVISNFLAHLSGFSDYLFIKDPSQLYNVAGNKEPCSWNEKSDSGIIGKKIQDNVKYYSDSFTTHTVVTFPWHNDLYSIYSTDSATILTKFRQQKLVNRDTLLNAPIWFSDTKTHLFPNGSVTSYKERWGIGQKDGSVKDFQRTGLVFIKGSKITFVSLIVPHMPEY